MCEETLPQTAMLVNAFTVDSVHLLNSFAHKSHERLDGVDECVVRPAAWPRVLRWAAQDALQPGSDVDASRGQAAEVRLHTHGSWLAG